MNWIIRQTWNHVLMVHEKVDPCLLQSYIPLPLDLYEGMAVVSIVPFQMSQIRFPFLPSLPLVSSLWELNLRTYVKVGNEVGVYFLTLDTDSALGTFIARHFFGLPYRHVPLKGSVSESQYAMQSGDSEYGLSLLSNLNVAETSQEEIALNRWAVERYQLFNLRNGEIVRGRVRHEPWNMNPVLIDRFDECLTRMIGRKSPLRATQGFYQRELKVEFSPFERIAKGIIRAG
jgi:hypothetical protein